MKGLVPRGFQVDGGGLTSVSGIHETWSLALERGTSGRFSLEWIASRLLVGECG